LFLFGFASIKILNIVYLSKSVFFFDLTPNLKSKLYFSKSFGLNQCSYNCSLGNTRHRNGNDDYQNSAIVAIIQPNLFKWDRLSRGNNIGYRYLCNIQWTRGKSLWNSRKGKNDTTRWQVSAWRRYIIIFSCLSFFFFVFVILHYSYRKNRAIIHP